MMPQLQKFEELDFYTSDEDDDLRLCKIDLGDAAFSESNVEDVIIPNELEAENPPSQTTSSQSDSILDSLLGNVYNSCDDSPMRSSVLSDSGISSYEASAVETKSETNYLLADNSEISIDDIFQFANEEESLVSIKEIPDFATKRNVYGTCFNVQNGSILRPARIDFTHRNMSWIEFSIAMLHNSRGIKNLVSSKLQNKLTSVKYGDKFNLKSSFTDIYTKTEEEVEQMETRDIQNIVCSAFNSKRMAVLLLGAQKTGEITGCQMTFQFQDNLRLALDTAFQTEFEPPIENILDAVDIQFLPVENAPSSEHLFVVIRVKQLRNLKYCIDKKSPDNR